MRSRTRAGATLIALLLAAGLSGCGGDGASATSSTTDATAPDSTSTPATTSATSTTPTTEIGEIPSTVDLEIQNILDGGGIPSLSAGIVIDDELVWAKNYDGVAGLDTVYITGSIQKPVTATAVLQLVERGLIDLDEDVSTYVGFAVQHPRYPDELTTTRLLLTHQSGLATDSWDPRSGSSLEEFAESIMDVTLPRATEPMPSDRDYFEALLAAGGKEDVWTGVPGTVGYSNIGFDLLAFVVAEVSGLPFEQYVDENIFRPLGMRRSGYVPEEFGSAHAPGHEIVVDDTVYLSGQPVPLNAHGIELNEEGRIQLPLYEDTPGAGGLRTTVRDLAEFLIAHMQRGIGSNGSILEAETADLMHASAGAATGDVNSFPILGQGMGWTLCADGVEGHVGGQAGFSATMMMKQDGDHTVGIVAMANVAAVYSDEPTKWDWFDNWYFPIEQLLFSAAEELAEA